MTIQWIRALPLSAGLAVAACGAKPEQPPATAPATEPAPAATQPPEPFPGSPGPTEPAPPAPPTGPEPFPGSPGPPPKATGCNADAKHCCQSDGSLAVPGGCQPFYRDGVLPATERGPDGYCQRIKCYKRCLPRGAKISTPAGRIPIHRLGAGDSVWTVDCAGQRVPGRVRAVISRRVIGAHRMRLVRLADGRAVRASAGHPTADGRTLSGVTLGDRLDGARVSSISSLSYSDSHTWDLLIDGPTGFYFSDGVRLGSTLRTNACDR